MRGSQAGFHNSDGTKLNLIKSALGSTIGKASRNISDHFMFFGGPNPV